MSLLHPRLLPWILFQFKASMGVINYSVIVMVTFGFLEDPVPKWYHDVRIRGLLQVDYRIIMWLSESCPFLDLEVIKYM